MTTNNQFENEDSCAEFDRIASERSPAEALGWLADRFAEQDDAHRVFEIRKMQSRQRAGQPLFSRRNRSEATAVRNETLERDLIAACREAGERLVQQHRYHLAWQFLSPLDDRDWVRQLLVSHPPTEDQLSEWIDVTLYQGAHPPAGYRRLLAAYGTCQAISTWDALQAHLFPDDRASMSESLATHAYQEIGDNICRALRPTMPANAPWKNEVDRWEESRGRPNDSQSTSFPRGWLGQMVELAAEPIAATSPHCDATHLSAVVRIGRLARNAAAWQQLFELCAYGSLLPVPLQYPDHPPFEETYTTHRLFYGALLGTDVDQSIQRLIEKLRAIREREPRAIALETVVDWLDRLDRTDDAIRLAIELDAFDLGQAGIAPTLLELGLSAAESSLPEYFQQRGDLLSYATLRLAQRT